MFIICIWNKKKSNMCGSHFQGLSFTPCTHIQIFWNLKCLKSEAPAVLGIFFSCQHFLFHIHYSLSFSHSMVAAIFLMNLNCAQAALPFPWVPWHSVWAEVKLFTFLIPYCNTATGQSTYMLLKSGDSQSLVGSLFLESRNLSDPLLYYTLHFFWKKQYYPYLTNKENHKEIS